MSPAQGGADAVDAGPAVPGPHSGGRLTEPLSKVLGTRTAQSLGKLGLATVGDLLRHYPRRYGSPGEMTPIRDLRVGEHVTVMAQVRSATTRPMRNRGGAMLEAVVTDGQDSLRLTFFAKRMGVLRMHEDKLRAGRTGLFTGTVGEYRGERQLTHPDYLIVGVDAADEDEAVLEASRPIPIYPSAAGVPTWRIGRAVRTVLDPLAPEDVTDPVPQEILERHGHVGLLDAWRGVHVPETDEDWRAGRKRLVFEEALVLQSALARRRAAHDAHRTVPRPGRSGGALDAFDSELPWPLTGAQVRAGEQIGADLSADTPMLRLLQGDVGSGKTLVALRAMLQVVDSGGQAALLAPTEVLAAQHLRTLRAMLGALAEAGTLGGDARGTRIALLTGSQGAAARRQALADAASGAAGIVVGTHALLSETVQFADLGLVVVDEQHRFGVEQRDALRTRGEHPPHTLVMTATPIPRTVAMTVFGDLETTVLDERPAGRAEVVTHVVPAGNRAWLDRVWARVAEEVSAGRRAYVVCPRIDEDDSADAADPDSPEAGADDLADDGMLPLDGDAAAAKSTQRAPLAAATQVARMLAARPELEGVGVGLLHGRMSAEDKDAAMSAFSSGRTPVLVSTTVIEVGVDVPEASAMVVLDAQHFGISQLHQLRGRIGRGGLPGVCLLVTSADEGSVAEERLTAVAGTTDGFALADKDVELRREGDVLGSAQSGGRNSLRLLRVVRDAKVIAQAREDAKALVAADPRLTAHPALGLAIDEFLGEDREQFLERG
ncbi:ATP-dependent DNA helicase RecG [Demequina zhanjiangensis]|uniref:Probable DNA 3'-5' helicase RecG n=1 Tax=Demequina zhanjiangensis TaxID=3051659 RepID=A0ABT8G4S6_9MICO|nr:ATP-dependent DNA helicase RecG [Demequina sp. SYSU T00b26]MDN4474145.1 ATP-dependent DNA helicase RecG [Demequina sp. SYSU T00b26]